MPSTIPFFTTSRQYNDILKNKRLFIPHTSKSSNMAGWTLYCIVTSPEKSPLEPVRTSLDATRLLREVEVDRETKGRKRNKAYFFSPRIKPNQHPPPRVLIQYQGATKVQRTPLGCKVYTTMVQEKHRHTYTHIYAECPLTGLTLPLTKPLAACCTSPTQSHHPPPPSPPSLKLHKRATPISPCSAKMARLHTAIRRGAGTRSRMPSKNSKRGV